MIRIKICCIQDLDEARMALDAGAHALGLVSAMPSGPGVISDARIAAIAAAIEPPAETFLLTSRQDPAAIAAQLDACRPTTVQLCDAIPRKGYARLRDAAPAVRIVQVVHVVDEASITEAVAASAHVDALLLDSGNPGLATKELGGTGRTHNWAWSRRIVEAVSVPVYLAGGLRAENVAEAVRTVRPYGLDVCSGVRTAGRLDAGKLARFIEAARRA
ncbi:MAG: phosphoribosylanthranilate isomerase [Rhodothermales bacterium]